MRRRLTDRIAAEIMNDPYNMNDTGHEKNDPKVDEYAKGGPSEWAEDPDPNDPAAKDSREETGHPKITAKMAAEAVASVRSLEERAMKCIVASQRILPGETDDVIETQAAELLHLPENYIDSLLSRQEALAQKVAGAAEQVAEEGTKKEAKKQMTDEQKQELRERLEKARAAKQKAAAEEDEMKKALGEEPEEKAEEKKEDEEEDEKEEKPEEKKEDEEEKEAKYAKEEKPEEKKEDEEEKKPESDLGIELEAAEGSLLDDIFQNVIASDTKQGAKKLSGFVAKQASEGGAGNFSMNDILGAPPDVSEHFR